MLGLEELSNGDQHSLDPFVLELNRLQNQLKVRNEQQFMLISSVTEKERELGIAQNEIKALKLAEVLKEKAVDELGNELEKLDERLRVTESQLEQKNLDIKKLINEKKEALAAQFAAEATLRRVHTSQKDDSHLPIESVFAPLEADIRIYRNEIAALQEDKKALERLTKSKEAALLEAERILRSALERALIVEEEENRLLEKTNRQKVLEVEKLSQTIKELEEAILVGGAAANAIRDYRRQISELQEERRTLERELARVKVSANRVATVVANEWKDEDYKVMPVKQWLEARRVMQAEMQRLRDKLAISERTARIEAQLKDKFKLRLKTIEEGLKHASSSPVNPKAVCGSPKPGKSTHFFGILSANAVVKKRSTSQPRASTISASSQQPDVENGAGTAAGKLTRVNSLTKKHASGENLLRKSLWASRSKVLDIDEKENKEMQQNTTVNVDKFKDNETRVSEEVKIEGGGNEELQIKGTSNSSNDDMVSGILYDRLQKEVISLRKSLETRGTILTAKDEELKILAKKVDSLVKALEVESKKVKKEATSGEQDAASPQVDDNKKKRKANSSKRSVSLPSSPP
ncbi:hypothetical protein RJ639_017917 [Escallonia herrerae]|uniref:Microtubule-associated protein 70-5 n=1 Tax=Escallonia herrerae TaxID=1293975 RepID=A0AA88V6C2_9ASTE|nr:hypothetical protein RJ639_017917 [Escallonia herrerae]